MYQFELALVFDFDILELRMKTEIENEGFAIDLRRLWCKKPQYPTYVARKWEAHLSVDNFDFMVEAQTCNYASPPARRIGAT